MAEAKGPGWKTKIQMGDGATPTEAWVDIAGVYRIDPIREEVALVEVTELSSEGKEFAAGITEGQELTVSARSLLENATQNETAGIRKKYAVGALCHFRVVIPGATKYIDFYAIIRGTSLGPWELEAAKDFTFTLKISGKPTYPPVT